MGGFTRLSRYNLDIRGGIAKQECTLLLDQFLTDKVFELRVREQFCSNT